MNRETMDRWCERGILVLALGILVYGPVALGAVKPLDFLVVQALTMGVLLLWGLRLWLHPRPQFLWPPISWTVVAFVVYALARYLTCDVEYTGRQELIRILVYAFLFFALLNNLHGQEAVRTISFTMIFLGMAISLYAVGQYLTGATHVWNIEAGEPGRASGTYVSPNHMAGFAGMLLPLGLAYTLVGRGKPLTKVFLGYAVLATAAGIAVTISRGGWMSYGFALVIFFGILAWHRNYRLPSLLMMLVLLAGGVFFAIKTSYFQERFRRAVETSKNVEVDTRFELWRAGMQMWRDQPWFGVGPAHYDLRYREYRPPTVQYQAGQAHNDYVTALADWGIVGAAIIAAALGALGMGLTRTWKHVRRTENVFGAGRSDKFAFVIGAAAGLLGLLAHSVVDFNMQIPANAILAVSLMALLSSHLRFATERYWTRLRVGGKLLASFALLAGLSYLGYQEWRLGREQLWLHRADDAEPFSSDQFAAWENAHNAEPRNFDTTYALGEAYRMLSFEGGANYAELATQAMTWFDRGMNLNPFDGYNHLRYGMCLDWLGRFTESEPFFSKAEALDPNGYFMVAQLGRHYAELEDYAAARPWFERSLRLEWRGNEYAAAWLEIVLKRLEENAAQSAPLPSIGSP